MGTKIDMGESFNECCSAPSKREKHPKYYPSISVPEKLGEDTVGKTVKIQVEGRVIGVRDETREGRPRNKRTEIEVRSVVIDGDGKKAAPAARQSAKPAKPPASARKAQSPKGSMASYSSQRKAESRVGG